jgi:hypothetical protein
MNLNFKNNNILETRDDSITKSYNDKITDFWTNEIWKINKLNIYTHIKNKPLSNFIFEYKNLEKEFNDTHIKFSINVNYDVMIEDNKKKIKKKIINLKKDNLPMLKIHSDCFIEYHNIIFDYLNAKNNLCHYDLEFESEINNNILVNSQKNFNYDIIEEQLNYFKKELVQDKSFYDSNLILNTLENNFLKIKDILFNFINQISENKQSNILNPILLIDVENVLKSFCVQDFLKSHISDEKFNKYFYTWNNGYFENSNDTTSFDNNSITLSEYSSKLKYIEPFTSLNLSIDKKMKLIKILIDKLIKNTNYHTINFLSTTNSTSSTSLKSNQLVNLNQSSEFINSSNQSNTSTISNQTNNLNLFIPIQYNDKFDIREQDDHLIIFLYILLKKINLNPIIISNDKFKWFNSYNLLEIKNFKIFYDFDSNEKNIIIDFPYSPPVYKINSNHYMFPFINYPILHNIQFTNLNKIEIITKTKLKKITLDDINIIFEYIFHLSIIETNIYINQEFTDIIIFCLNYLEYFIKKFNKIDNFLSSNSKEKIFKISIETNSNIFDKHEIKNYLMLMENYLIFIKIYIVIKFVIFKNYSNSKFISIIIPDLCKIFDLIIGIYDIIDIHIYKIRKLSCSKSELEELFKKINTIYIYVRKQGYLKKNIY